MQQRDVTGLILAGGQSHRFGTDKALYPVEGQPMICHVYNALAPLVSKVLVSVREPRAFFQVPIEEVVDQFAGKGPLAGVHAGLVRCHTPWLFVVACDTPFLKTEVLRTLINACSNPEHPVVACTPDGRLHPLCAIYPISMQSTMEAFLVAGRYAMHEMLLAAGGCHEVLVPQEPLRNVNTRADLPEQQ